MATITGITAVRPTANTSEEKVQYGATIAVGQPVYIDSTDNKAKLADNNASAATATVKGIAITPGVNGSTGYIATGGSIILVGASMGVGQTYCLGATAGTIVDEGDVATGNNLSRIGSGATTEQLDLDITNTGIVHA